ncbi:MAG: pyruvate/phosphoenolpyruvate kinase domain-containing protein, partial [bacterium]
TLPPFFGIRIKPFTEELKARSLRTLDLFLTTLLQETGGQLPANFVVTLPKITSPEQPAVLGELLQRLESELALPTGSLVFELMIETTQSIINERGEIAIRALVDTAPGRIVAAHFGTYDYTASCSITAAWQTMDHPACDFARHVMQVALAGTGIWLSDGATNVLPVPPHRAALGGRLSDGQALENRRVVHDAWRLHYGHVRRSLEHAWYQGWDLHPGQLPTRYAAVYGFFMEGLDAAAERLRNFVGKAAQATLVGDIFDDAATGQGLLNYFLRAINCGALTEEEAVARTGVTLEEFRGRSFVHILANRRGAPPA